MEQEIPGYKDKKRERSRKPEDGIKKQEDEPGKKKENGEDEEDEEETELKKKIKKAREKARELEKQYNPEQMKSFIKQPKQKAGE